MRIEKLVLKNYRRFKNLEILFDKNSRHDLHFIMGDNGTGKTNLLNAINWCLYGKEPHESSTSNFKHSPTGSDIEKLPRLNVYTENSNKVLVELWVELEDNNYVIFHREESYDFKDNKTLSKPIKSDFYVDKSDHKGNRNFERGNDANLIVQQLFPEAIKEYFFFDGERLDTYFQETTAQQISQEIFIISYINALESMKDHSEQIIKDLEKEAGQFSSNIEETRTEIEETKNQLKEVEIRINETKQQLEIAKKKINEYHSMLKNQPNVGELERELSKLKNIREKKYEVLRDQESKKRDLIFDYTIILGLWPVVKSSLKLINDKKNKNELPPVNEKILEETLKHENCDVCGRYLDAQTKDEIFLNLKNYRKTSKYVKKLEPMENPLRVCEDKANNFKKELEEINNLIKTSKKEFEYFDSSIISIKEKLGGYDIDKIKNWHLERENFENIYENNLKRLGQLETQQRTLKSKDKNLKNEFDKRVSKNKKANKIQKKIKFINKALNVILKTRKNIMNETRSNIEKETKTLFFGLLWKKSTFKDIKIDSKYNMSVIHELGYECLNDLSAAERELLALSFTLALHKVSGYDAPILIDTPIARIAGENRENFANTFLDITKEKQIILLLTPDEYSEGIKKSFNDKASNKYQFIKDEKFTTLEVLK